MSLIKYLLIESVSTGKLKALMNKLNGVLYKNHHNKDLYPMNKEIINNHWDITQKIYNDDIRENIYRESGMIIDNQIDYIKSLLNLDSIDSYDVFEPYLPPNIEIDEQYSMWGFVGVMVLSMILKDLEEIDPTDNLKYGNWLIDVVVRYNFTKRDGSIGSVLTPMMEKHGVNMHGLTLGTDRRFNDRFYEDLPKYEEYLQMYHELKNKNKIPDEYKDINVFKINEPYNTDPFMQLYTHIKEYVDRFQGNLDELIKNDLEEGEDYRYYGVFDNYRIYEPISQKSRSILGANTEWCTTYGEHCLNVSYKNRSPIWYDDLWILINDSDLDEKYQFHFETDQFMDGDDNRINLSRFLNTNNEVHEFFMEYFEVGSYDVRKLMIKASQ